MKIYIEWPGDPSVGIRWQTATVEMDLIENDPDYRRVVRESLEDAFDNIFDGKPDVVFEDEIQEYMP